MKFKHFFSRQTISNISKFNGRGFQSSHFCYRKAVASAYSFSTLFRCPNSRATSLSKNFTLLKPFLLCDRFIHSGQEAVPECLGDDTEPDSNDSEEEDPFMNEFLSRFVYIMRGKLSEVYPHCDKKTIDGMLMVIVTKVVAEMKKGVLEELINSAAASPSQDLSEDLWKTVWEVSNVVLQDMDKAKRKEEMKIFLQSEEVKEMCRFASEVGIRGDMLRELRFKWAHQKLEDSEFWEELVNLREEETESEEEGNTDSQVVESSDLEKQFATGKGKSKSFSLPKRHGKIKYKIYGLDLSEPKWAEVADKIRESGEVIWPQEPTPISGKCEIVTEKILALQEDDDPSQLIAEWMELLQPSRVDWIALLGRVKERSISLYLKVAELLLGEESFQPNIRDYSKLIDAYAMKNQIWDAERILKKMYEKGIPPDVLTCTTMVHMYSKVGDVDRAQEAFESLRTLGFKPNTRLYHSMIMAYINAGKPKLGESLMREMESKDIKPTTEIYMSLLGSFAQNGDVAGANRISTTMEFAGVSPSLEFYALLVKAYGRSGEPDSARAYFDQMIKLGTTPSDECIATMLAAYERKNLLDKGLELLLQLEKDGVEHGVATYSVMIDWLGKLQLIDEAEELLGKIAELGETPSHDIHVSLCDMYARAGAEKKALQALGVLEAKKDELRPQDFERIIKGLLTGGFVQDAQRIHGLMEARGFVPSDNLKIQLMGSRPFVRNSHTERTLVL